VFERSKAVRVLDHTELFLLLGGATIQGLAEMPDDFGNDTICGVISLM
jgi:hypothetical protein